MQYLVYVHNHAGAGEGSFERAADVCDGDALEADKPAGLASYARILVDVLEPNVPAAIERTIAEALEFPREHGESIFHMTSTTSLDMVLGPGFDKPAAIARDLGAAWEASAGRRKSA